MELYNTLTRKKQTFKPLHDRKVGIYSCGPTVYWNQHIGHLYAYVHWDALVRALRFLGFDVTWVMNITDVGHLTSDEDVGEDKMEKGARRENLTVWQVADKYITQFTDSLTALNITRPDVLCRATEHIQDQIDLIKKIESRGFTYRTSTGLVFDTSKFPDYPKFAHLKLRRQQAGSRVEVDPGKKQPWDFLLWVTNQPQHIMQWDSPWGRGYPGWHIECTAMSTKYLGDRFDIHTGGQEHIPIHHTNEIAQGYGAFGHQTADFWLHNAWLLLKGEKMSKSLGNMYTVQDLIAKGYDPLALRYLIFTSHYRQGLNFTFDALDAAVKTLDKIRTQFISMKSAHDSHRSVLSQDKLTKVNRWQQTFTSQLEDDLNLPGAIATVHQMLSDNIPEYDKVDLLLDWDQILGFNLSSLQAPKPVAIPPRVLRLVQEREQLRQGKRFSQADQLRHQIEDQGYTLEDTPGGPVVKQLPQS
jgi:cysteinyl-tRNA synthetase